MAQWLAEGGGNYSVAQRVIGRLFVALTSERLTCGRNGRKRTGQSCFYDCYECMMFYEPGYTIPMDVRWLAPDYVGGICLLERNSTVDVLKSTLLIERSKYDVYW